MKKQVCSMLMAVFLLPLAAACGSDQAKAPSVSETIQGMEEDAMQEMGITETEEAGESAEAGQEESETATAQEKTLADWAEAFCGRRGEEIVSMSSEQVRDSLGETDLLVGEEPEYDFGWSSPWPWDSDTDYRIVEEGDGKAVILYYAWVSDPHITVWRETLDYHMEETGVIVDKEALEMLDAIRTGEEYAKAYPYGINGTPMDYANNGAGEALNDNAAANRGSDAGRFYEALFEPETAAVCLLNLTEEPDKVKTEAEEWKGGALVRISFAEDGSMLTVLMRQPYGEDGIWIPQDALAETESGTGQRQ